VYLWNDKGPVRPEDMEAIAGDKLHLYIMTPDYKNFYHVNPKPTGEQGEYRFSFEPENTIPTRAWAVFKLGGQRRVVIADIDNKTADVQPPQMPQVIQSETPYIMFTLHFKGEVKAGKTVHGAVYATHKATKLPYKELEPLLGSYAHVLAFASDFKTLYPAYPMTPWNVPEGSYGGPEVQFDLTPTQAGMMKLFVEVRTRGEDLLVPFIVRVAPAVRRNPNKHLEDEETPLPPPDAEPAAGF
jgi:hypothetical protein